MGISSGNKGGTQAIVDIPKTAQVGGRALVNRPQAAYPLSSASLGHQMATPVVRPDIPLAVTPEPQTNILTYK